MYGLCMNVHVAKLVSRCICGGKVFVLLEELLKVEFHTLLY